MVSWLHGRKAMVKQHGEGQLLTTWWLEAEQKTAPERKGPETRYSSLRSHFCDPLSHTQKFALLIPRAIPKPVKLTSQLNCHSIFAEKPLTMYVCVNVFIHTFPYYSVASAICPN